MILSAKSARSLVVFVLCVASCSATPIAPRDTSSTSHSHSPIALPITRRRQFSGPGSLLDVDRARIKALIEHSDEQKKPTVFDANVTNVADLYLATIGIGTPPTDYTVILDSGSSNTWVGANKSFVKTRTAKSTGQQIAVSYGSGNFSGEEYTDIVILSPGLAIQKQSIGVASTSQGLDGLDGILGIGPTDLTRTTLVKTPNLTIPTVTDNAFSQGLISAKEVGISFEPTNSLSDTNGVVSFGGVDSSRISGKIAYVPITTTSPSNRFVGIDSSVTYGSSGTPILSKTAGIVDTGTTFLLLATDAMQRFSAATGAKFDSTTGTYALPVSQFQKLQSLFFHIGDTTYEFTADAQILPRSLNSAIGGTDDNVYFIVNDIGTPTGSGEDFVLGMSWLERFYFVYDSGKTRVGFAITPFTKATSNFGK
ncbi:family A1 protease [Obba rivulosa]|uniref:Family A1 protease n=1 Tax=Obba rivulosa TaxID=1052685 RepID=A0A8E2B3J5_9APHY|nr:family A1 protease [Obba rivulosa]